MENQLIREQLFEILHNRKRMPGERFSDIEGKIEHLVNQEVEKRIAERMSSEELRGFFHELIQAGRDMNDRDRLGNPYLSEDMYFKDFETRFRSRLTNPGDSQKTEGGGE